MIEEWLLKYKISPDGFLEQDRAGMCPDSDREKVKVVVEGNRFGGSGNPVLFPYDEIAGEIREVIW